MTVNSKFYTRDDLTAWDRIKNAFANDWEQTKADFGANGARDMDQDVDDTIKQMAGSDDAFENREQAFRFGYVAKRRYGDEYGLWDNELDDHLRAQYDGDYDADRPYIQHAYEFDEN